MEIKSNFASSPLSDPLATRTSGAKKLNLASGDSTAFGEVDSLESQLTGEPSVRSSAVARAQQLIAEPAWPTAEVLGQVSAVLANHISQRAE
jgi:hypothetical protein